MRLLLLVTALVAGCAHKKVAPPPEQLYALGTHKATWRDWSKASPCQSDVRRVQDDLDSMNRLLSTFLGTTSAGAQGMWADEHVALLEQGIATLGPPLLAFEQLLSGARKCGEDYELYGQLRAAEELATQAKKRLEDGPELLKLLGIRKDIERWKQELPTAQATASKEKCKAKRPEVFFSFEDDRGRTEWLFCDGSKVVAVPGAKPALEAPPDKRSRKPKPYLDAAAAFPPPSVSRCPKMPVKPVPKPTEPEPLDELGT